MYLYLLELVFLIGYSSHKLVPVSFELKATAVQVYLQNINISICFLYISSDFLNK